MSDAIFLDAKWLDMVDGTREHGVNKGLVRTSQTRLIEQLKKNAGIGGMGMIILLNRHWKTNSSGLLGMVGLF